MAVLLADELRAIGCGMDPQEFREVLLEMKAVMYPSWTDEDLLCHWQSAGRFCAAVQSRVSQGLKDDLILRTLINARKQRCRAEAGGEVAV